MKGENGSGLLIDTDFFGTISQFFSELKKHNLNIADINYVIATHYHPDHMGLISELMKFGVKLVLLDTQVEYINFSNEIFKRAVRLEYEPIKIEDALIINFDESRNFLNTLGIYGEIISTPSHSEDSISIVLDNGVCFIGDLEPFEYLNAYEQNTSLERDWNNIFCYSPKCIYYGHINEKIDIFK